MNTKDIYEEVAAVLHAVVEHDGGTRYDHEEDEIGTRACCNVVEYKPHVDLCFVPRAKALRDRIVGMHPALGAPYGQPNPPSGGEVVAWHVLDAHGDLIANYTDEASANEVASRWEHRGSRVRPLIYGDTAPPSAPVGAMTEASRVPDDYRNQASGYRAGWNDAMACRPSAPVGVEAVLAKLREGLGADGTLYQQAEGMIRALAQQPASEAQRCTCPSGDGSLRWPCPAHPAEAQAQGGGEVVAWPEWLVDRVAQAIREDGKVRSVDWDSLSDERKAMWRSDAHRALAVMPPIQLS